MPRSFSIITVSKSRLDHLKQSLPSMLAQGAHEVIVVDYSCPEGSADYVEANFPDVRVVRAENQEGFSNWHARNLGAEVATGDLLVFCDVDTVMSDGAIAWIEENLPDSRHGFLKGDETAHLNKTSLRLAQNQLKGFIVIPRKVFKALGGYDDVLEGWGAGGDTDLVDRLRLTKCKPFAMDPKIISEVVVHDNSERVKHHAMPIRISYGAGLLYRAAKLALLRLRGQLNLPLPIRRNLYRTAKDVAAQLSPDRSRMAVTVNVHVDPIRMPRQLGFARGKQTVSIRVEVAMEEEIDEIPG